MSSRREYLKAYREAKADHIYRTKRIYYEANRERILLKQREYFAANREKLAEIGAALRRWRIAKGMNQTAAAKLIELSQPAMSLWENGAVPIDFERIERLHPEMMEAFG